MIARGSADLGPPSPVKATTMMMGYVCWCDNTLTRRLTRRLPRTHTYTRSHTHAGWWLLCLCARPTARFRLPCCRLQRHPRRSLRLRPTSPWVAPRTNRSLLAWSASVRRTSHRRLPFTPVPYAQPPLLPLAATPRSCPYPQGVPTAGERPGRCGAFEALRLSRV